MRPLALVMRPTENGWAVYLTNGQELARYQGYLSEWFARRYLLSYVRKSAARRGSRRTYY